MAIAAIRSPDQGAYLSLEQRIRQIRTYAEDGYPENVRKELLVVVDDFRALIPAELRAAVSAKSGQYLRLLRKVNAGFGDQAELDKMTFEMLTISEAIWEAIKEPANTDADPADPAPAPLAPTEPVGEGKIVTLPRPARPKSERPPSPAPAPGPGRFVDKPDAPVVVRAKDISKRFSSTHFELADLSFELKLGQITAVVGRNGSGKSTLLRIVLGELASDTGSLDYPMLEASGRGRRLRENIGYVAQRSTRWRGYLRENLEFTAAAYGIRGNANIERVTWLLNRFGLVDYEDHTWSQLSGGYQLRFDLARAMLHGPSLLIFDEPLANLDVVSQQEFLYDLKLIALSRAAPAAILVTSQHLFEMEAIADQLILLREGQRTFLDEIGHLGADRQLNSFEVTTDASEEYLREALRDVKVAAVRRYTTYSQLDFPVEVPRADILRALSDLPAGTIYIRDISCSSRTLMTGKEPARTKPDTVSRDDAS